MWFIYNLPEIGLFYQVKYINKWQPFPYYLTGFTKKASKIGNFGNKEPKTQKMKWPDKISLIVSDRAGMETFWSFLTTQSPEFKPGTAIQHVVISWEDKILLVPT